jgi:hypothetical protein
MATDLVLRRVSRRQNGSIVDEEGTHENSPYADLRSSRTGGNEFHCIGTGTHLDD